MRFRLRTLLIVLALGPPVLAGAWFVGREAWRGGEFISCEIERTPVEQWFTLYPLGRDG
jgi:hypothetical protein